MRLSPALTTVACILAGALMPLAFAPFYLWWIAPAGYAALFFSWRDATPRQAFVRGFGFGAAQFLFGIYWIWISVHEIAQAPVWIAVMLMLALVAVMALYPAITGFVVARWFRTGSNWLWLGAVPALLVIAEWLRGWLFTGFGWMAPGYAQTESWLFGFAPLIGSLGIGWIVFVVSGAAILAVTGQRAIRIAAVVLVFVLFLTGFLLGRIAWTEQRPDQLTVALAQGAVPQELKWVPSQLPATLALYRDLTVDALGAELIVWPEVAIPEYYEVLSPWVDEIDRLAGSAGSSMLMGMMRAHESGAQNTVYISGQREAAYIKRHLVPYGEYFPIPEFMKPLIASINLAFIDTQPGDPGQPPIELLGELIAVTICYEDVFAAEQLHYFPEATLLVNVSNDGWFGDSIMPHQHLQIAQMRSAEVRRWQLRSTNTGLTAIIDPFGRVDALYPQFEPGVLRASVRGMTGSTPYIFWGNWLVLTAACAIVLAYLARTKLTIRPGT